MSNFTEELLGKKLRKSDKPIRDYSDPKLAGFLMPNEVKNYQETVLECNIECWYDIIKECTFSTVFCPLTIDDAKLFISIYEKNFKDKDVSSLESIDWKKSLNSDELIKMNDLVKRLEDKILEMGSSDDCVFVKTSSRSAKDSPLATDHFRKLYVKFLNELDISVREIENEQIICLLKAAFQCLKIKNAKTAIDMLIQSERIYQDMLLAIEMPSTKFKENLVIRKFYDIDIDMEFRGFVFNGNLNALSQYNFLVYSERLNIHRELIADLILNYYRNVVSKKLAEAKFVLNNFVIDFAVFSSNFYILLRTFSELKKISRFFLF